MDRSRRSPPQRVPYLEPPAHPLVRLCLELRPARPELLAISPCLAGGNHDIDGVLCQPLCVGHGHELHFLRVARPVDGQDPQMRQFLRREVGMAGTAGALDVRQRLLDGLPWRAGTDHDARDAGPVELLIREQAGFSPG